MLQIYNHNLINKNKRKVKKKEKEMLNDILSVNIGLLSENELIEIIWLYSLLKLTNMGVKTLVINGVMRLYFE